MKFLSDILAKAGLTVDGVVTLNNTATGQTPDANDNSTKLATTAWVRTFVQPYSLPIASASVLGGVKVGSGLSINSSTGVLSVTGGGAASIKSTQTFIATAGQTVFTISGGYTAGLIDVFLNGVYLSPNQTTATNGTTVTLSDAALVGDIIDVIIASPIYQGATTTTDQLPEGVVNLYYTDARARAAISLTTNGSSGVATYIGGILNIPNYRGLVPAGGNAGQILSKVDGTDYNTQWLNEAPASSYTSQLKHVVKAGVAINKGQAVYVTSADGTNMIVGKASNASEATSSKTLGLLESTASANGFANVITEGLLSGLDTTGANAAGDPVWLGTDGNLIYGLLNKPTAPAHLVFIGVVTRRNANNGEIFVKVQNGFEMKELHDYVENGVQNNFVISYESSTSLYKPKSIATLLGYTPADAARTLTINGTSYDLTANRTWTLTTSNITEGTNLYYTDGRVGTYLTANSYATQSYVSTQINNLVSGAPGLLDTLDELAAALGDDPNFATTVSTALSNRLRIDINNQGLTSTQQGNGRTNLGLGSLAILSSVGNAQITDVAYSKLTGVPSTFTPSSHTHPISDITGLQTALDGKQASLSGTGFVKISGSTISYDNSTYYLASNPSGYITGITSLMVTNALGYTPYNAGGNTVLTNINYTSYALRWNSTQAPANGLDNTSIVPNSVTLFDGYGAPIPGYPSGAAQWWVGALTIGDANRGFQIAGGYADSDMYFRKGNSTWSTWRKVWTDANLTNLNQLTNGPGYITGYTETDTLASVTARGATTSTNVTLSGTANQFSGHHYFLPWDSDGNHYPHYNIGSNNNGSKLNLRMFGGNGSIVRLFFLNGNTGAISWDGNTIWHAGNLTNLNQLANGPGYITGYTETDTLASVTGRGASTSTISNFNGGLTSAKTSKNTYAIQIKGGFYGAPRLQLYDLAVDGNAYVGLGVDMSGAAYEFSNYFPRTGGNGRWSVGSWAGDFGSGQYVSGYNEKLWLTESAAAFNVPLTVNGVLYFTDTTNGFYKSGGRLTARSESTDNVANFASYGLYLPKTGETAGLYVESPIEARGGIRMGGGAANGSITVGADTGAGANRLVQRDAGGDTYVRYSFAVHFNQTGGNSENPTIGQIWTQSTTDNYVRKSTPAHFISQLGLITTSNYSSYSLPLSGGVMTGALVNNTDGAVLMESNASENNNWLWKENAKQWGLFWFNRGSQAGQTIGTYSTVGAELMFMGGSSGIAMPSAWTGYIAGSNIAAMISNWNGYIYSASTVFAATSMVVGGNTVLHAGNFSSYSVPVRGMSNWNDSTVLDDVIGMLAWKNYGNNHVIFDASQSTAPNGTSVNNTNSQVAWTGTYPTLMGWNGSNTYGVRVDSARVADSASNASTVGGLSADTFYRNLGFGSGYPSWDLNSVSADRSGFTYSNNAPWTGPFLHIGASGYGMQFNASYGDGSGLSYRVRNGDNATWGSWRRLVWEGGTWSFNISGNAGSVNGRSVGNAAGNIGYFDSNGNLYVNNPESYGGEVRLGAAWGRGGVYASSTLSLSTSSSNIHFVFGNSVPISMDSNGTINIGGSTNAPLSITGGAHKYLTINPGNGWEAMVRYIGGSGSGWYVGKRTSGQLVGTQSFHFYSEEAGATVGGITPSGVLHTTGGATLNGQVNISRHIDANTSWGSCTSIFVGWSSSKVILGNNANSGHDYALNLGCNSVVSTNAFFCHQDITAFSDARVKENVEVVENAVDKVKAIRGVTFTRNDTDDTNRRHVGVIAQEVLAVLPEAVSEDDRGHYSVAYGNMAALFIEAIKEQQAQIESQKSEIEELKDLVKQLINR